MTKGPENVEIINAIKAMRATHAPAWMRVAELLVRPTRQRASVNTSKLDEYNVDGGVLVVPGKVLGAGITTKKLTVAALSFSAVARAQIAAKGGKCLTLPEAVKAHPKGTGIVILI